jgi:hypothetical protein
MKPMHTLGCSAQEKNIVNCLSTLKQRIFSLTGVNVKSYNLLLLLKIINGYKLTTYNLSIYKINVFVVNKICTN